MRFKKTKSCFDITEIKAQSKEKGLNDGITNIKPIIEAEIKAEIVEWAKNVKDLYELADVFIICCSFLSDNCFTAEITYNSDKHEKPFATTPVFLLTKVNSFFEKGKPLTLTLVEIASYVLDFGLYIDDLFVEIVKAKVEFNKYRRNNKREWL
jgi:hypothetical protein